MRLIPTKTFFNLSSAKQERIITAALEEFSKRCFDQAKLSNIIRNANIPRGSFYQYFDNKKDLYLYLFKIIGDKKVEYLKELLSNKAEIPFLELFKILYAQGIKFAIDHPQYMGIYKLFISTKGPIYDELMGEGYQQTKAYYINYIKADKAKGIIRKDVDAETLADLVINLTTNIALTELEMNENIDYNNLLIKINKVIDIFKKGIE